MPDKRIDDEVKQFLDWSAAQAREGYTIANLMLRQEQFIGEIRLMVNGQNTQLRNLNGRLSEVESEQEDLRGTVDQHSLAIAAIKRRVRTGPQDQEMDTGVHQLEAIRVRLAEQEQKRRDSERVKAEEVVWWKRSIIGWVAGAVGVVVTSLLTVLITLAIANSTANARQERPMTPPPKEAR